MVSYRFDSAARILFNSVLSPPGLVQELLIKLRYPGPLALDSLHGIVAVSHQEIGHPAVVFFKNPLRAE